MHDVDPPVPRYSGVRLCEQVQLPRLFFFASPGDVLELMEDGPAGPSGVRITALVLERVVPLLPGPAARVVTRTDE